jgi:tetratricopeptide (TPR) repeat protein
VAHSYRVGYIEFWRVLDLGSVRSGDATYEMKTDRKEHVARHTSVGRACVALLVSLMAASMEPVGAQSAPPTRDDQPDAGPIQSEEIVVDEEITVVGQSSLRLLRLEVQVARERVYGLFNSLNSDDEFDIHCQNAPRTGTRIPRRVCRPRYADNGTGDAGKEFLVVLQSCGMSEACLEQARSRAQAIVSEVPVKDQELDAEVQRLTRDNAEFQRAIANYQVVEHRYAEARREVASGLRVATSVIDSDGPGIASTLNASRDDIVAPEPIELATPEAPWSETDAALSEGWVKLRYSVLANGTTANVRVVDAMPLGLDTSSPVAIARTWAFEPATVDGVPINWHNNLAVVTVRREQDVHAGWPDFAEAYQAVAALVADARYEEAKARNAQMLDELAATLEEMAFAEMQRAGIEHALEDPHAALDAIRRATEPTVEQLGKEELGLALEHRFALELELGLAADALETYERRTRLGRVPPREPMARSAATLEHALKQPDTGFAAQGRIGGDGDWGHSLTWPTVAVGDVDGRIDGLGLICNRDQIPLPFEIDVQMTIPAGWGDCVLLVEGRPDTTFVVYELREPVN